VGDFEVAAGAERYQLSKGLRDIIQTLPSRELYHTRSKNYFVMDVPQILGPDRQYRVFFDVRNAGAKDAVILFVESAYPAARNGPAPSGVTDKKVGIRVLIGHALRNTRAEIPE
jgi:hypothetical protein